MEKIRTGVIRCDLHATYYAPLMQEVDWRVLREPEYGRGGYFYHYTHYADPGKIMVPTGREFEIVKVWDYDRKLAENMSKICFDKPEVCDSFEEVSDGVDLVFIPNCNGDGSDHLELATPGIEKGIPTFVDKPFAFDVADARKIVELAKKHGVPIFSRSMLSEAPHAGRFRNCIEDMGGARFGIIRSGSIHMAWLVHSISLALHVFGTGIKAVEAMGQDPKVFAHLDYGDRSDRPVGGVAINGDAGPAYHCSFHASAYGEQGAMLSPNIGDFEFPFGAARILEKTVEMLRTGKPPVSYDEMVEIIAVATAIRKSVQERRRVDLSEV